MSFKRTLIFLEEKELKDELKGLKGLLGSTDQQWKAIAQRRSASHTVHLFSSSWTTKGSGSKNDSMADTMGIPQSRIHWTMAPT